MYVCMYARACESVHKHVCMCVNAYPFMCIYECESVRVKLPRGLNCSFTTSYAYSVIGHSMLPKQFVKGSRS